MDTETIERILELAESTGEGAYTLAVMLIAKGYFVGILWFVFGLVVLWMIWRAVKLAAEASEVADEAEQRMGNLRSITPNLVSQDWGRVTPAEWREIRRIYDLGLKADSSGGEP